MRDRVLHGEEMNLPAYLEKFIDLLREITFNVDTLASELSVIGEIDTGSQTSPVTILTPSSGKRVDLRSVYLASDSTSGSVRAILANSGQKVGVIYCSKFALVTLQSIKVTGQVNESVQITWTGLDNGAKIFYALRYKEI